MGAGKGESLPLSLPRLLRLLAGRLGCALLLTVLGEATLPIADVTSCSLYKTNAPLVKAPPVFKRGPSAGIQPRELTPHASEPSRRLEESRTPNRGSSVELFPPFPGGSMS
jgi:hypothetical protein